MFCTKNELYRDNSDIHPAAIVTVHVYSKNDEKPTVGTIKLIRVKPFKEVVVKKREFILTGEEKTAFRFTTDGNGKIIDFNKLPANLVNPLE